MLETRTFFHHLWILDWGIQRFLFYCLPMRCTDNYRLLIDTEIRGWTQYSWDRSGFHKGHLQSSTIKLVAKPTNAGANYARGERNQLYWDRASALDFRFPYENVRGTFLSSDRQLNKTLQLHSDHVCFITHGCLLSVAAALSRAQIKSGLDFFHKEREKW